MSITIQHGRASIPIAVKINACGTSFPINATIIEPFPASNHSLEVLLNLLANLILYTVVNITNTYTRMQVKEIRQIDSVTQPRVIQRVRISTIISLAASNGRPLPSPAITFVEPLHSLNLIASAYLYTTKSPLENKYHSCKRQRALPLSMHPAGSPPDIKIRKHPLAASLSGLAKFAVHHHVRLGKRVQRTHQRTGSRGIISSTTATGNFFGNPSFQQIHEKQETEQRCEDHHKPVDPTFCQHRPPVSSTPTPKPYILTHNLILDL